MGARTTSAIVGALLTLCVAATANAQTSIQLPPPTLPAAAPLAPAIWFDGSDATVIAALQARITDPFSSQFYSAFKSFVDTQIPGLAGASDSQRTRVAKGAAFLHVLGVTPPPATGAASYRDAAVAAMLGIGPRSAGFFGPNPQANVYSESAQLQSMAEAFDMLRGSGTSVAEVAGMTAIIENWSTALADNPFYTGVFSTNDHATIRTGAALVTAALALPEHPDADDWLADGMTGVNQGLNTMWGAAGWGRQGYAYTGVGLSNVYPAAYHVQNVGNQNWFKPLEPMASTALVLRQPDGMMPPFEDSLALSYPWEFVWPAYPDEAETYRWAYENQPQVPLFFDSDHIHSVSRFIVADPTTVAVPPETSPTRWALADTWGATLASAWDSGALQLTNLTARDFSNADGLNANRRSNMRNPLDVIIHCDGEIIMPTSSGGPQLDSSASRGEYRSPLSKNVITIENTAQFIVNDGAVTMAHRVDSHDDVEGPNHFADFSRTAVANYIGANSVRRTVIMVDESYFVVSDQYSDDNNNQVELLWRGRDELTELEDESRHVAGAWSGSGGVGMRVDTTSTDNMQYNDRDSLFAPAFNVEESIEVMRVDAGDRARIGFTTIIQKSSAADVAAAPVEDSNNANAAFTLTGAGFVDRIVTPEDDDNINRLGVTSNGELAIVRTEGGAPTGWAMLDADHLAYDGGQIRTSERTSLGATIGSNVIVAEIRADEDETDLDVDFIDVDGIDWTEVYEAKWNDTVLGSANFNQGATRFDVSGINGSGGGTLVIYPKPCLEGAGPDPDEDRYCGDADNCPDVANADQLDTNNDGTGDACECADAETRCDDDNICTDDTCRPTTGDCINTPVMVIMLCDDGTACTEGDVCIAGTCTGQAVDCDDDNVCTADSCEADTGCVNAPTMATCGDGNPCTENDRCVGGACVGDPVDCDDSNVCTKDSCDPASGCTSTPDQDGTTCDDGNACTSLDVCQAGTCAGSLKTCDDANPCTEDSCDVLSGCQFTAVPQGQPCDDGNACTTNEACFGTQCIGPFTLCNDNNECTDDSCDPSTGCVYDPTASKPCNDGDACTTNDMCAGGSCDGVAVDCDDDNPCTTDSCDPIAGCVFAPADGPDCDDGNACTSQDTCSGGLCAGEAIDCNDGNICTADSCDPATGCTTLGLSGGVCDDDDKCTDGDTCDNGTCTGEAITCGDANPCTSDNCTPDLGCFFVGLPNGTACDDGNDCTTDDVCTSSQCGGVGLDCDDDNPCTIDNCDADGVCTNIPDPGLPCDDGSACTNNDVCQANGSCSGLVVVCDDGNPCTVNNCDPDSGCIEANVPDGTSCDDDNICTESDACLNGTCAGDVTVCNDDNPCTNDTCLAGVGCEFAPANQGAGCNDGSACTNNDSCDAGICVGTDIVCDDGNACTLDACDAVSGCTFPDASDGSACDDGNDCTDGDLCDQGECVGESVTCNDDNPCTTDSCAPVGGCGFAPVADGTACDDGDICTVSESCVASECVGSPQDCDDGLPCTIDSCDSVDGCTHVAAPSGTACDDNNACSVGDMCAGPFCIGAAANCDDNNTCTTDSCDPVQGCQAVPVDDGTACNDGESCTVGDVCDDAVCVGSGLNCDDGNPCTADSCDLATGECLFEPLGVGTPCSDGTACTEGDVCTADATCEGAAVDCSDDNPCTIDTCSAETGCVQALAEDGTGCNDGDLCTSNDACSAGVCAGQAVVCDDGNTCTTDSCDVAAGCKFVNVADATACDDENSCTDNDACVAGTCTGDGLVCDDGNPCTVDDCDPAAQECVFSARPDDTSCNDDNACSFNDRCIGGSCVGDAATCDDGDPCTVDSCDTNAGCIFVGAPAGLACDDGNPCTADDACDAAGVCAGAGIACDDGNACTVDVCGADGLCASTPAADGLVCSDGDACTIGDSCLAGACVGVTESCNDDDDCTVDSCDPTVGCVFEPAAPGTGCDDDDACTADDVCSGGVCSGLPTTCDDGDPCTVDSCGPGGVCQVEAGGNGTTCDDGDGCTVNDECIGGICSGAPLDCSDDDPCTVDLCTNNECQATPLVCGAGRTCVAGVCVLDDSCVACADQDDCEGDTLCVELDTGMRCVPACDEDGGCADGAFCAQTVAGEAICLVDEGPCSTLPPDVVDEGPVAEEVEPVEEVEVVEEVEPVEDVVEDVIEPDVEVVDSQVGPIDTGEGPVDTGGPSDTGGAEVDTSEDDGSLSFNNEPPQRFNDPVIFKGGGCQGGNDGRQDLALLVLVLAIAAAWLRRRRAV